VISLTNRTWADDRQDQTGAELNDTVAALPAAFTYCLAVILPAYTDYIELGNLLDKYKDGWFNLHLFIDDSPFMIHDSPFKTVYTVYIGDVTIKLDVTTPQVVPHQWARPCVALDFATGMLRVVVDSLVLTDQVYPALKEQAGGRPSGLTGMYFGYYGRDLSIHKFTDLQVYSSLLSTERMVELTRAGSDQCGQSRGDYLAWEDMQWTLTGGAAWETVFQDEPCAPVSELQLYPRVTDLLVDAVHHCGKVSGRIQPVTSVEEFRAFEEKVASVAFDRLQTKEFFPDYYEVGIWTAITDQETEGEWRDLYTGED
jgi:hypothetical protein